MDYPIFISGRESGVLHESRSGLYTVFEAELPGVPERLLRLWVHGAGESAYLGVPLPAEGGLRLRRRLSALERAAFPAQPVCASDGEKYTEHGGGRTPETSLHNIEIKENIKEDKVEGEDMSRHNNKKSESGTDRCPWPAPVTESAGDLLWFRRPDGSLTAYDGVSTLLALPAVLRRRPRGAVLRKIEGVEYLVFRY